MKRLTLLCTAILASAMLMAQPQRHNVLTVDTSADGIPVQSTMYGVFFEDINYGADGGLYGEMVKNRSFEFDQPLMGWQTFGNVEVRDDGPFDRAPHYIRLRYSGHPQMSTGVENESWFGMGVEEGKQYRFTVWARTAPFSGVSKGRKATKAAEKEIVTFHLCKDNTSEENQMFFDGEIEVTSSEWKKYEVVFTSPRTEPKATLRLFLQSWSGDDWSLRTDTCVDLEHISLFPVETFNGDSNGLRKDVAQAIADLHPGVLRFPGGCIVEGTTLEQRYQWKDGVGPVENRKTNKNRWMYTFDYRLFPDYYQSYGLGFYEFFRFAEEIGAEALPVISCGMACQFQNDPEDNPHAPLDGLQPYIDDALDLIEFANGDTSTKWGKVRADMGHPESFNMKYLAVGNEQWGKEYVERLEPFVKAIRAKYPEIQIIGSSGPYLGGEWFDELWPEMRRLGADLVDEHFYSWEGFFERNADRYDSYPREGSKVFAGEYACHGSDGKKYNHFNAALVEAAFMTGLERNADVVHMATYAPLLAHVDGWQWRPDLIWFDNLDVVRTCSYYVQQLYSTNKGTHVLPLTMDGRPVAGKEGQRQLYATCAEDREKREYIVKVVNLSPYSQPLGIDLTNLRHTITSATVTTLHSDNPVADNTVCAPLSVVPQTSTIELNAESDGKLALDTTIGGRTFAVYKFAW